MIMRKPKFLAAIWGLHQVSGWPWLLSVFRPVAFLICMYPRTRSESYLDRQPVSRSRNVGAKFHAQRCLSLKNIVDEVTILVVMAAIISSRLQFFETVRHTD